MGFDLLRHGNVGIGEGRRLLQFGNDPVARLDGIATPERLFYRRRVVCQNEVVVVSLHPRHTLLFEHRRNCAAHDGKMLHRVPQPLQFHSQGVGVGFGATRPSEIVCCQ
ncbi:MAG: hypothetical protein UHS32_07005 [Bacteroidaceae bacterium]|nr:hypothetical protein [Bacteroidaceae bacterium]